MASFRRAQKAMGGGGDDSDPASAVAVGADGDVEGGVAEEWTIAAAGRKRKRDKDKDKDGRTAGFKGLMRRRTSSSLQEEDKKGDGSKAREGVREMSELGEMASTTERDGKGRTSAQATVSLSSPSGSATATKATTATPTTQTAAVTSPPVSKPKLPLGLVDYGSDEDEDD